MQSKVIFQSIGILEVQMTLNLDDGQAVAFILKNSSMIDGFLFNSCLNMKYGEFSDVFV